MLLPALGESKQKTGISGRSALTVAINILMYTNRTYITRSGGTFKSFLLDARGEPKFQQSPSRKRERRTGLSLAHAPGSDERRPGDCTRERNAIG